MAVQYNIFCKNIGVGCYIAPLQSNTFSLKWILLFFCISDIWCMCSRGLCKYAYLLNSLPSCLLRIPCSPVWCQIAKVLGSTSIRHRSHASAFAFVIWGAVLTRPECSPAPGYLHVRCLKWWRPHEVISSSDHYSDVIMSAMVSQSTGVSIVYSTICLGVDQRKKSKLRITGLCEGN